MIKLICMDLDGTIYSSEKVLEPAYSAAVTRFNEKYGTALKTPTTGEIIKLVGQNPRVIYATLFPELDDERCEKLGSLILEELCQLISMGKGELLGGVRDFLENIVGRYRFQVVSNGRKEYIESVLRGFRLDGFGTLRSVLGDESKGDLLRRVMREEGVGAGETLMVGDRENDLIAARECGVKFVGCCFGHSDPGELAGADRVISNFSELTALLENNGI